MSQLGIRFVSRYIVEKLIVTRPPNGQNSGGGPGYKYTVICKHISSFDSRLVWRLILVSSL